MPKRTSRAGAVRPRRKSVRRDGSVIYIRYTPKIAEEICERIAAGAAHRSRQSGARGRLDRHRVARHDRRCHQVRPNRGRGASRRLRMRDAG